MHEILIANDPTSIIDQLVPVWSAQNKLIHNIQIASDDQKIAQLILQRVKPAPVVSAINMPPMDRAAPTEYIQIPCPPIIAIRSGDFTIQATNIFIADLLRQRHIESDSKATTRHRKQKINRWG